MRAAAHTQASRLKVAEDATAAADVAAAQLKAEAIAMAVVEAKAKAARLKAEVQAKAAAAEAELEAEAVERQRQVSRPGVAPAERPGCNKRPTTVQQRSRRPGEARRAVIPSMPPRRPPQRPPPRSPRRRRHTWFSASRSTVSTVRSFPRSIRRLGSARRHCTTGCARRWNSTPPPMPVASDSMEVCYATTMPHAQRWERSSWPCGAAPRSRVR